MKKVYIEKFDFFKKLRSHIHNFSEEINELKTLGEKIKNLQNAAVQSEQNQKLYNYMVELILSVKYISEYIFIEEDFWNGVNGNLIRLAKAFLTNLQFFMEFFKKNITPEINNKIASFNTSLNAQMFKNLTKKEINSIISEIIEAILPNEINYHIFGKIFNQIDKKN
jgi:hypothetical protein